MKYFIITVDAEGDNLWKWKEGQSITTHNVEYVSRFQKLCESYHFPPVYLTNYEMIMDSRFAEFLKKKAADNKCEIGMHIHAWNSPPDHSLTNLYGGNPFITEYPLDVQKKKLQYLKKLIEEKTEVTPVSFRSGRWATDQALFQLLDELCFLVDCSVTPGINHYSDKGMSVIHGNNYNHTPLKAYHLTGNLIEVPMTTAKMRTFKGISLRNRVRNVLLGKSVWLRPAPNTADEVENLIKYVERHDTDYIEFMIHSSELMPGGSPYTKDESAVELYYKKMKQIFEAVSGNYKGITLSTYYQAIRSLLIAPPNQNVYK